MREFVVERLFISGQCFVKRLWDSAWFVEFFVCGFAQSFRNKSTGRQLPFSSVKGGFSPLYPVLIINKERINW